MTRGVELFLTSCPSSHDEEIEALGRKLEPRLRTQLQRLRVIERRNQTILGRALLVTALRRWGVKVGLEDVGREPEGGVVMPAGFFGSISHTDGVVGAVAVKNVPIGLDVEHRWHSFCDVEWLLPSCSCSHHVEDCDCLARLWVGLEAIAKASKKPLFDGCSLSIHDNDPDLAFQRWSVITIELKDGVFAAVASAIPVQAVVPVWLERTELLDCI